jgi:transposase
MLSVEEQFMIKELYRNGVSISAIARRTGRDRKTIRRIIHSPLKPAPTLRHPRKRRARKLDPYLPYLEQRIQDGVLNAEKLFTEIQAQGYPGGRSQVKAFVQPFRQRQPAVTVRFETAPGEQAQVDWGHFGFVAQDGRQRRLYGFVMTLGWSRAMYLEFTVSADIAWFLRCHLHAFHYFGGMPHSLLYDNLKSVVLNRDADGTIHWNPRYLDFADSLGFTPRACQPYRAQTKGKVESGIKYVRYNFWPGLHFTDLPDLNQQARTWLNTVANPRVHGTTGEVPFVRLLQEGLRPLPDPLCYDTSVITTRRSTRDCFISYEGNFYSVPASAACQSLMVRETEGGALIISTPHGQEVARHRLVVGFRQRVVQPGHLPTRPVAAPPRSRPRAIQVDGRTRSAACPWSPPCVEVRPLSVYEQLLGGGYDD